MAVPFRKQKSGSVTPKPQAESGPVKFNRGIPSGKVKVRFIRWCCEGGCDYKPGDTTTMDKFRALAMKHCCEICEECQAPPECDGTDCQPPTE